MYIYIYTITIVCTAPECDQSSVGSPIAQSSGTSTSSVADDDVVGERRWIWGDY